MKYRSMRQHLFKKASQDPWAYNSAQAIGMRGESEGDEVARKYFVPGLAGLGATAAVYQNLKDTDFGKHVLRGPEGTKVGDKINAFLDRKKLKLTGANVAALGAGTFVGKKVYDYRKKKKEARR